MCENFAPQKFMSVSASLKNAAQNVTMRDNNVFEVIGGLREFKLIKHNSKFIIRMSAFTHSSSLFPSYYCLVGFSFYISYQPAKENLNFAALFFMSMKDYIKAKI